MIKKLIATLTLVLTVVASAFAQDHQVTGTVTDSAGEPVIGASVLIGGTKDGTFTDIDGNYSLTVAPDAVLTVSSIGFQTQEVPVGGRSLINITLNDDSQALEGTIVVAFGTAKKDAYTGSAAVVKSDDIARSQQSNAAQALVGKVAGVQLTNTSGQPGSSPSIRIRGFSSLNAGNDLCGSLTGCLTPEISATSILPTLSP